MAMATTGSYAFSCSRPSCDAMVTVTSLPIALKQTSFINSAITGFTLPGIMDEPGCSGGRLISKMPVRGPDARNIRSLEIFDKVIARFFSEDEYITNPCMADVA